MGQQLQKISGRNGASLTLAIALSTSLAACGGEDSSLPPVVTVTPTPTPTPTNSIAAANAIVQQSLRLDLANLDNYAAPSLPAYYDNTVTAIDNTPANDPVTDPIATLGRVLFYDRSLSFNDTISCASCHQQSVGFDDDERFSEGFNGGTFTDAHAMRLGNIRYYEPGDTFWDRRADTVEDQATQPILDAVEMGWNNNGGLSALFAKMDSLDYYPVLFEFAFGDTTISEARLESALAQFQRSMISSDSRWDRAYAQVFGAGAPNRALNQTLPGFSVSEQRGRALFMTGKNNGGAGCLTCHIPPTFALDGDSRSNGLDAGETVIFKSPSLKNVGKSQFLMHDGRFTTLLQVVEHYDTGIQNGPALDNRLRTAGVPQQLGLTASDRQALVDFMLTLTDETLESDAKFGDPFIR